MSQAQSPRSSTYIGRFAPSPTGPLHFGSLVTAVGSFLQARTAQGQWLLRIDDLDSTREVPGAANNIIATLAAFGFEWHGEIQYQSKRRELYAAAVETLRAQHRIYACTCSRAQIASQSSSLGDQRNQDFDNEERRYLGTCRELHRDEREPHALRFIVDASTAVFSDGIQGITSQRVDEVVGDFVVRRRDGIHAYHLAVVVDDDASGVTEVVRGADLLSSTPRQILLQQALRLSTPKYIHLPLAVDANGAKLSKSGQSIPINSDNAADALWHALKFLRQQPPPDLRAAPVAAIWNWSIEHWSLMPLLGLTKMPAPCAG